MCTCLIISVHAFIHINVCMRKPIVVRPKLNLIGLRAEMNDNEAIAMKNLNHDLAIGISGGSCNDKAAMIIINYNMEERTKFKTQNI